jgi:uncharacterized membrane protein YphA (DoxX/SURF4 family)
VFGLVARRLASREVSLNCCRFTIGIASVVLLVALRVTLGWHFFSQGVDHYHDPNWSSEGFLRQAKGPWAEFYTSKVPDFHGFHELISHPWRDPAQASAAKKTDEKNSAKNKNQQAPATNAPTEGDPQPGDAKAKATAEGAQSKDDAKAAKLPTEGDPSPEPKKEDPATKRAEEQLAEDLAMSRPVFEAFATRVVDDWNERGRQIAAHYGFDQEQKQRANAVFERYKRGLLDYLASIESDLILYQRELGRLDQMQSFQGSTDIPFASQRLADKRRELANQPNAWLADVRRMEREFNQDIAAIATDEQEQRGALSQPESSLKKNDRILIWAMMICGGCLIVGLFTRLAAVGCAAFLLMVIMSQPPWVPGTITTLFPYQLVEMLALLALATTAVGRWGGLDFFLHFLITAPFRGRR